MPGTFFQYRPPPQVRPPHPFPYTLIPAAADVFGLAILFLNERRYQVETARRAPRTPCSSSKPTIKASTRQSLAMLARLSADSAPATRRARRGVVERGPRRCLFSSRSSWC